ncbi:hypothetical protein EYF80_058724 [Liparis tanakae]|uniref:Uncharacterized protein n=1 Tax=Liparis tanakae TaxID=230148 RepID=A0A4Z2EQQ5_9TELE|nr:hypothetical protein EYF80_058724 [Liparis tanakae]
METLQAAGGVSVGWDRAGVGPTGSGGVGVLVGDGNTFLQLFRLQRIHTALLGSEWDYVTGECVSVDKAHQGLLLALCRQLVLVPGPVVGTEAPEGQTRQLQSAEQSQLIGPVQSFIHLLHCRAD